MITRGLGVGTATSRREELVALLLSGRCVPALPFELTFPEVFFPDGNITARQGFHGILGNPPWDSLRRADDQFFGSIDFAALVGATKQEKKAAQDGLLEEPSVRHRYDSYVDSLLQQDRTADALFSVHKARVADQLAGRGSYDAFMLFAERGARVLSEDGCVGWVLPSAFHANEGATGLRRLYLEQMALKCCYSFENRCKLFEIDSRFKFALVVASRGGPTSQFPCAFYLHDNKWLFGSHGSVSCSLRRTSSSKQEANT